MKEKEVFIFELSEILEYSKKGNKTETATISMRAPRMPEFNEASRFSQIVTQALMDSQKWAPKGKVKDVVPESDIKAGEVRILLFASDRNIDEVAKRFRALANKVCTLDEEGTPLKDALIDKMDIEDFTKMMCEYVANFIYPSLFKDMEEKKEGENSQKESGEPL